MMSSRRRSVLTLADLLDITEQRLPSGVYVPVEHLPPPCPFCGTPYPVIGVNDAAPGVFAITCQECRAMGPPARSIEGAMEAWKARVSPTPSGQSPA